MRSRWESEPCLECTPEGVGHKRVRSRVGNEMGVLVEGPVGEIRGKGVAYGAVGLNMYIGPLICKHYNIHSGSSVWITLL